MSSGDFNNGFYTLPRHGQSSREKIQQRTSDGGEKTQWIPSSSPAPNLARSPSPDYSNTRTPYASPQRPYVSTNLQSMPSNGRVRSLSGGGGGSGEVGNGDSSPDPHEFYRQLEDPFVASSSHIAQEEDRNDRKTTGHSYQRNTASSSARSQGLTSKYSTLNSSNPRPSVRISLQSANPSTPERPRQPSLKDLVDRFNQSDEPAIPSGRQAQSRKAPNNVSFLRSRTPSASTPTLRELSATGPSQSRPVSSTRPLSRRKYTNEDVSDQIRITTTLPPPPSQNPPEQRRPLFGEILASDTRDLHVKGHHRSGSESSLYPPSPVGRGMEYSPLSPTAWYLGSAPTLGDIDPTKLSPDARRGHQRAKSDFAGNPPTATGPGKFTATLTKPDNNNRYSQSKIPRSTRRPNSHERSPSLTPERKVHAPQSSPSRIDNKSPNSLKAYISAPLPKKSPPLRSSRPRQPISSNVKLFEHASSRDHSQSGDSVKKKLPELGGVDFAARRERIQRAFTKSVRESEKDEVTRKRISHYEEAKLLRESSIPIVNEQESHKEEEQPMELNEEEAMDESTLDEINFTLDTILPRNVQTEEGQQYDTPDSPTLGMPGSFPTYESPGKNVETESSTSTAIGTTPIDNEPQVNILQHSPSASRNVLSQILQMRQSDQDSPTRRHDNKNLDERWNLQQSGTSQMDPISESRVETSPRLGSGVRDTMSSDYSAINRVFSQYHRPEEASASQQRLSVLSPELARQGGWDPTRVTQLYLRELTKDGIEQVDPENAPKNLPSYQLSDGAWSSARDSLNTDNEINPNSDVSNEWIDASPSMVDWMQPHTGHEDHPPSPPPKDHSNTTPLTDGQRDDAATPTLNLDGRPILPEIATVGEGLGIALKGVSTGADSPTIPPFPAHSPPIPPSPEFVMPVNRTTNSPSLYSRNPASSIFPSVFPDGMAAGPTAIRISGDDSSHSHSRSPGTPLAPSQTPPTSDSRSQERPSQDYQGRQSLDLPLKGSSAPSTEQKRLAQRRFIIKELVDTEKSFLQDMTVTDEIYRGTASPPLSPEDVKILFGNSDQIVAFSKAFLEALKQAAQSVYVFQSPSGPNSKRTSVSTSDSIDHGSNPHNDLTDDEKDRKTFVGEAFGQHMSRMEKVYSEYLRNHDAANKKLAKIQTIQNVIIWLQECRTNADDLTTAWSLDSLLVKPVQRILKFPLILGQLLEVTPENHPDFTALDVAVREMMGASHRINEMKKRADVLEKVVGRKRKESDVRTGLSKAFGRRTEKFRQQVGLSDMFEDREYAEIAQKFGSHFMHLHLVMKDVEIYTMDVQLGVERFIQYISAVENFVQVVPSSFPELESKWRKFGQAMREMVTIALADHKNAVRKGVIDPMITLLKIHDGPQKIMAKRNKRIMDYAKLRALRDRGDKPDKRTIEQGEQFVTLNETLKDELPKLFSLTTKLVEACLDKFVGIQMEWQTLWQTKIKFIIEENDVPTNINQILQRFSDDFVIISTQVESLSVCNGGLLAEAVNFLSPSNTLADDRSATTSNSSSTRPTPPTNRRRTLSMNSEKSAVQPTPDFIKRNSSGFSTEQIPPMPSTSRFRSTSAQGQQQYRTPTIPTSDPAHQNPARSNSSTRGYSFDAASTQQYLFSPNLGTQRPSTPSSSHVPNVFTSALPMTESPTHSPISTSRPSSRLGGNPTTTPAATIAQPPQAQLSGIDSRITGFNVLFLAASLFEFNIDRARKEAGYPYLTYVPGEIFDVIGEKGELWLAKNQDDSSCLVGWIWCKHFARLENESAY